MASYQGHLMFSSVLGAAYGSLGVWCFHLDWGPAILGAGVTALGGLLPDLDSDSGVPVRELFNVAAAAIPLMLMRRLMRQLTAEETLAVLGGVYLFIRFALSKLFKRWTVHRGMFHSIPTMLITGLIVYLLHHSPDPTLRMYIPGGVMIGFLSHLVLDELCSVDFMGAKITLNKFAGSALKFWSPSMTATAICYVYLTGLAAAVIMGDPPEWR